MVDMQMQVEAVYENGVLRRLEPLALEEHQHVTFT
jgi:predicted DNA-binding antitoxin AbrB/MazE fold protein